MTGRSAGYCAGYGVPGYMNPVPGRGGALGAGRGFGRGLGLGVRGGRGGWGGAWAGAYAAPAPTYPVAPAGPTPEQQREVLQRQVEYLEDALDGVRKRIADLEAKSTAQD